METGKPLPGQSAFERYELNTFDESGNFKKKPEPPKPVSVQDLITPEIRQKLNDMRDTAKADGHKEGYSAGFEEGKAEGLAAARAEVMKERAILEGLRDALNSTLPQREDEISESLLSLAMNMCKVMFRTRQSIDPKLILPVIKEAVASLPYVESPGRILVNPEDAHVVRDYFGTEIIQWAIEEDPRIERGGCKLITKHNQIDATNAVRWNQLVNALSLDQEDWEMPTLGGAKRNGMRI